MRKKDVFDTAKEQKQDKKPAKIKKSAKTKKSIINQSCPVIVSFLKLSRRWC